MQKILSFLVLFSFVVAACEPTTSKDLSPTTKIVTPSPTLLSSPTPEPTQIPTSIPTRTPQPPICATVRPAPESVSMELFCNFHAMGVTVTLAANNDNDKNAQAFLEYQLEGDKIQRGFPLTRINDTHFIGSMFWLQPGKTYEVQVTFLDPQTPLDCAIIKGKSNTRNEPVVPESPQNFFVTPEGTGETCSLEEPCVFSTALTKSGPDTSIILRGGVYYQGNIKISKGGEDGKPLIIKGYPGEEVIFDGAEPELPQWELKDEGIYATKVADSATNLVFVDDMRLYPYKTLDDLKNLKWDLNGYFLQGNTLHLHLKDNADLREKAVAVSRFPFALWLSGGHTYLLDISFRHYSENRYQQGAVHLASSDNLLQGNKFYHTHAGIAVEENANRNTIQGNSFSDTVFDWKWDAAYAVYDGQSNDKPTHLVANAGIRFLEGDPISRGNVIRHNTFHDTFDGFQVCPNQATATHTNETDIYENQVYRVTDDGMETDGYCSNVRIWGNTFNDVLAGISLAPVRTGPVYVLRNLIYNTGVSKYPPFGDQPPCCGNSIKLDTDETSGYIYLFNNTAVGSTGSAGFRIAGDGSWNLLYSRNNIWAGSRREAIKHDMTQQTLDLDYDALIYVNSSKIVYWNGKNYSNLQKLISATNFEVHGLSDTKFPFFDPSDAIYTLLPSSSLIDAGVYIPGINDNYVGTAPDIGAFEFEN